MARRRDTFLLGQEVEPLGHVAEVLRYVVGPGEGVRRADEVGAAVGEDAVHRSQVQAHVVVRGPGVGGTSECAMVPPQTMVSM